jgi:hypothetical protein
MKFQPALPPNADVTRRAVTLRFVSQDAPPPPRTQDEMFPEIGEIVASFKASPKFKRLAELQIELAGAERYLTAAQSRINDSDDAEVKAALDSLDAIDDASAELEAATEAYNAAQSRRDILREAYQQLTADLNAELLKLRENTRSKISSEALAEQRAIKDEIAAQISDLLTKLVLSTERSNGARGLILPMLAEMLPQQETPPPAHTYNVMPRQQRAGGVAYDLPAAIKGGVSRAKVGA